MVALYHYFIRKSVQLHSAMTAAILVEAPSSMAGKRTRFSSDGQGVAGGLVGLIDTHNFLPYSERLTDNINRAGILRNKALFQCLRDSQSNLSFSQTAMEGILRTVASKSPVLHFKTEADASDWVVTMARRTRAACRHIEQARVKKPEVRMVEDALGRECTTHHPILLISCRCFVIDWGTAEV